LLLDGDLHQAFTSSKQCKVSLDLKEITASYASALGQPPFDPWMMTALLLHAYASGLYSWHPVGRDEETIRACIKNQEPQDRQMDQLALIP